MRNLGAHSRQITLIPNVTSQILSIAEDRNEAQTFLISVRNLSDGNNPAITLTGNYGGPSGTNTPILTQLGPGEQVQYYLTGSIFLDALANLGVTCEVSVTATGGGHITVPPQTFFVQPGAVAFLSLSPNNGYAPPGKRWFTVYADNNFDLQFRNPGGGIVWQSLNILPGQPIGPLPLPPGLRFLGKGNAVATSFHIVWSQRSSG